MCILDFIKKEVIDSKSNQKRGCTFFRCLLIVMEFIDKELIDNFNKYIIKELRKTAVNDL